MKDTATEPLLLSESKDVQERFEEMIHETLSSIFRSFSDGSAFSGIDPHDLREKVCGLGFLPEHGRGFEAVLKDTEAVIIPNPPRTWAVDYRPHLPPPRPVKTRILQILPPPFEEEEAAQA